MSVGSFAQWATSSAYDLLNWGIVFDSKDLGEEEVILIHSNKE